MKPSRVPPFFFSNASRYSERSAIAALMSTSLKVVSMAAVFCASFRRWAMVRRSRVILTRSSPGCASRGARAAGAAVGEAAGRERKSSTSPLVIRPSLPVPSSWADCRPRSSIILPADGIGACAGAGLAVSGGAGFVASGDWVAGRETGPRGAGGGLTPALGLAATCGALAGAAPASIVARTEPTSTSAPSCAWIASSTPA